MSAHSAAATLNIRETVSVLKKSGFDNSKTNFKEKRIVMVGFPAIGIEGNEVTDQLAKMATQTLHDDKIKVPYSGWKAIHKKEMMNQTRNRNEKEGMAKGIRYFTWNYIARIRKNHGLQE